MDSFVYDDYLAELDDMFKYHQPTEKNAEYYPSIRNKARELAYLFADLCPDCAETFTAVDKLREAVMWANAGIAIHGKKE